MGPSPRARNGLGAAAAVCVALLPGCLGSDDDGPAKSVPERVDSTARYEGERAAVASILERWEETVLADDAGLACRDVFAVEENRGYDTDNGGVRFCERDDANSPAAIIAAAGGEDAYDLVVEAIVLDRRAGGDLSAKARITAGRTREVVSLRNSDQGGWRITSRTFPEAWGRSRQDDCRLAVELQASLVGPPRGADNPREAALDGVFAEQARRVLRHGGSFEIAQISYRPDYTHLYALQSPEGQLLSAYPVGVWGPRSYDASSKYFCQDGRLTGIIA